jgi:hypothetical protein
MLTMAYAARLSRNVRRRARAFAADALHVGVALLGDAIDLEATFAAPDAGGAHYTLRALPDPPGPNSRRHGAEVAAAMP